MSAGFSRLLRLGTLTFALAACSVAGVDQAPNSIAQNRCTSEADCAGGSCVNGECRSRSGTIRTVLFEVTPPADGTLIAGAQFLKPDITLPSEGELQLVLDPVSQVAGRVTAGKLACGTDGPKFLNDSGDLYAIPSDASISAYITFIPSSTALGLYSPPTVVKSGLVKGSYFGFSVNLPPGEYDIYIEPGVQADDSCPVPPQLRRGQLLKGGSLNRIIPLPAPSTFELHVSWPLSDHALDHWHADMLDPVSGRVISNSVELTPHGKEYVAKISYFPVVVGETVGGGAGELVRLSPPAQVAAPTVLMTRSALGLFDGDRGTLDKFTSLSASLPTPIRLKAQVTGPTRRPVASSVTLVATTTRMDTTILGIQPGVWASFVRKAQVGADGQFELDVLPGTYRVSATPNATLDTTSDDPDARLAQATETWVLPDSPSVQAGKVVTLGSSLPINGQVFDSSGTAGVATALVQALPSPATIRSNVVDQALGESSPVPRASIGNVAEDGTFGLIVDGGTFDLSVRPQPSTGFGWVVFPSVGVQPALAGPNLGKQSIPLPVSYSGTVTMPGSGAPLTVPNALIRAYIYMSNGEPTADASKADSVLQVAETRANNDGTFEVLIPASVNQH